MMASQTPHICSVSSWALTLSLTGPYPPPGAVGKTGCVDGLGPHSPYQPHDLHDPDAVAEAPALCSPLLNHLNGLNAGKTNIKGVDESGKRESETHMWMRWMK